LASQAQLSVDLENQLINPLLNKVDEIPTESIYMQTDKDIYETGEDIWFSATILKSQSLKQNTSNKIFYFNLLNEDKSLLYSEKFPIKKGGVNGHFYLSDTLNPGDYILTGYTANSINNLSSHYKTYKHIKVTETIIPKILVSYHLEKLSALEFKLDLDVFRRSGLNTGKVKLKLRASKGSRPVVLEKTETDSLGKAILKFEIDEDYVYSDFILEVKTSDKLNQNISLDLDIKKESLQVLFFPEGGNLLANVNQKIGVKLLNSQPVKGGYTCVLYEDQSSIDTLIIKSNGLGQFFLNPKPNKSYSLKVNHSNQLFQLPKISENELTVQFLGEANQTYKFNILSKKKSNLKETVYVRIQSKGIIKWLYKGELKNENTSFYVPKKRLGSEITDISVFDEHFNILSSRLFFPKFNDRIKIKILSDHDKAYSNTTNVKLKLQLLDNNNRPIQGKINISIFDKLYENSSYTQTMESFFKIDNELNLEASNFINFPTKASDADLFLLTTPSNHYRWNPDFKTRSVENDFSIDEDIRGKVLRKAKHGQYFNIHEEIELDILSSNGLFKAKTDSLGNFIIDALLLKQFEGEKLIIKTQQDHLVIKVLNKKNTDFFKSFLFERKGDLIFRESVDSIKINNKLKSFSFNSTNFLDEVLITGYNSRHRKKISDYDKISSSIFDYVCHEYQVFNCNNHPSGFRPVHEKIYVTNDGSKVKYIDQEIVDYEAKKNKKELKNYLIVKPFYRDKEFNSHRNGNKNWDLDYRKTLLWKSNLQTDKNGVLTLDFNTSDIKGEFICEIDAFTFALGIFGYKQFNFFVY